MTKSSSSETTRSPVQWFVECDAFTNESLERELSARGLGSDAISKYVDMLGSDGKSHDVLSIPSSFVRRLMATKTNDGRYVFRLWKRNGSDGLLSPADFLNQGAMRRTKSFRSAADRLNAILAAKAAKAT